MEFDWWVNVCLIKLWRWTSRIEHPCRRFTEWPTHTHSPVCNTSFRPQGRWSFLQEGADSAPWTSPVLSVGVGQGESHYASHRRTSPTKRTHVITHSEANTCTHTHVYFTAAARIQAHTRVQRNPENMEEMQAEPWSGFLWAVQFNL